MPTDPKVEGGRIESDFRQLDADRQYKLEEARESAALTLPPLLPPEGWNGDQPLPNPYQSIGSQGATSMSSQLSFALIPPNGLPFYEFSPDITGDMDATIVRQIRNNLARSERRVMNKILATNVREALLDLMQQALVIGDAFLIYNDDFHFRTVRFDHWVVERYANGLWDRVIYREPVRPDKLPESWGFPPEEREIGALTEFAYTEIIKHPAKGGKSPTFTVTVEFRGREVEVASINKGEKYIVLQWKHLPGENYGQSYIDECKGDLRTAEGLTQSLVEGAAANSEFRWLVRPGGVTQMLDLDRSTNGDFLAGRSEDIDPLQLNNVIQLQTTLEALSMVKRDLARKFLLGSELQPTGDRVTATQVRELAQSLEDASGGIFSTIASAFQIPIVQRTIKLMDGGKEIEELLNRPDISLNVKTGLETLSREVEHQRVLQLSQILLGLPDDWRAKVEKDPALSGIVRAFGQDPNVWIKADEDLAAETSALQENAIQQQASSQAISTAGRIAEQGAAQ